MEPHADVPEAVTTPPAGGVVASGGGAKVVLTADDVARVTRRMAHELIERNKGITGVVLVGLQRGGVWLAEALADAIERIEGVRPPVGTLDVAFHRDDIGLRPVLPAGTTSLPAPIDDAVVVLVDDVLYTGRTIRAALDALTDLGRPRCVQLAVMVDRGHRELPIRPDVVGKNLPTRRDETVRATAAGVEIGEAARP